MRRAIIILFGLIYCLSATSAAAERRVALVIGMSKYQQVPRLANPSRDAEAIASLFRKAGFDLVDNERDLGISELRRVIREFSELSQNADVAVVYYAGHGIEVDGINYLVPTDAKLLSDFDVEDETVSLDRILKALEATKRLRLIILDACRDNPFNRTMKRSIASRSVGRGLAKVEPTMSDTLIAFAAKAGAVASDGEGQNSPFAAALVKYLAEPGLDLRLAFGRVRDDVLKSTANRQEPFVYGSLGGDTMALVPPIVPAVDPEADARTEYELAAQIGTQEAWDSFLMRHSVGLYANLARAQTNKLIAAQQSSAKADEARRQAEAEAASKAEKLQRQLAEQNARQVEEAKRKLSEQAKKDLEESRRQIAEQAKKELEDARRQLRLAQQEADAARKQVDDAKRQAAAEAQLEVDKARLEAKRQADKMASLTPTEPTPESMRKFQPEMDQADITRLLQAHLKRVGCNLGTVDGNWDESSKKALDLFNKNAKTTLDVKVASLDALDVVRSKSDRVCPLVCAKGQHPDNNRCVQTECAAGFSLNSAGACKKKPSLTPKARTAARREPVLPRQPSPSSGRKCFNFNGKTYCE